MEFLRVEERGSMGWDGTYENFSRRENCESEGWEERDEGEGVDEEENG